MNEINFTTINQREYVAHLLGEARQSILSPSMSAASAAQTVANANRILQRLIESEIDHKKD